MPAQIPSRQPRLLMLDIHCLKAFSDNYIWAITTQSSQNFWVVDPGDAKPVMDFADDRGLELEGVLLTHHHFDHDGGIPELLARWPELIITGGNAAASPHVTEQHADGQNLHVLGETANLIDVPGHTLDHVAFLFQNHEPPLAFTGDTLFAAGCGRLFEGTAEQMFGSLQRLASLPENTQVYCAHEYTASNLLFALEVEPDNPEIIQLQEKVNRLAGEPSIPSTIKQELSTNPFMRCDQPNVIESASRQGSTASDVETLATLRNWKDHF
jgi:hydroxyacylglutathione hydrolase